MTTEKPHETIDPDEYARWLDAQRINSDAFFELVEARRLKAWAVAAQTLQHLCEVAALN